jgi:signal-transduction protein with cAMP-binding, CBS, and nucleotidyltransferase domain
MVRHAPLTILASESVESAAREMQCGNVGCLIVVDRRNHHTYPIGIITDRDIAVRACAQGLHPSRTLVSEVMSAPPVTVAESQDFATALETMRRFGVRRLPVVNSYGGLDGIVTMDDLVAEISRHLHTIAGAIEEEQSRARGGIAVQPEYDRAEPRPRIEVSRE